MPLQAVELIFPKLKEAKRIHGELVSADFNLTSEQTGKPFALICELARIHTSW